MNDRPVRVLIVEDSMVAQNLLKGIIAGDSRFEIAGIAINGRQAVEYVQTLKPDVVSMDIQMPVMDGVEATREILQVYPVPIIIVSSLYQPSEVEMAMRVLEAGAVTILPRPYGPGHPQFAQTARQYLNLLKSMSQVKVIKRRPIQAVSPKVVEVSEYQTGTGNLTRDYKILVIGASAGGPEGIKTILSGLSPDFNLPIIIVQHIDGHFAQGFCDWLNDTSKLPVSLAGHNEMIRPGHVYLPPGDKHLVVKSKGVVDISDLPPEKGLRPSVAVLFRSVARIYGKETIALLLSGMGADGAAELKILRNEGAFTMVQDQQSCLVFGMPGAAVNLGAACKILSPDAMITEIGRLTI
jgi:two-component system chemotaxis response regulator CheB